jgi:N-acetylneuraminate synthase
MTDADATQEQARGTDRLGLGRPGPILIGEVGQAHEGSLGLAHQFVDAVADAGADAVKFQTHIADAESTPAEPWRVKFSPQDERRYDYWRRMEFTEPQWLGLREHADERGLLFLSTPFSFEAVELLDRVGVSMWKIASGEVSNLAMLEALPGSAPVLLSSGMSTWQELDDAVEVAGRAGRPVAVLQCTSAYPTRPEQVGLNLLAEYRDRWGCAVGLSDHSGTIHPALAATTLGADVVELHVTLSPRMFGPDIAASVSVEELATVAQGMRAISEMLRQPIDKDVAAGSMTEMRRLFTRSLVARTDLPAGHVLSASDLVAKKPGSGIPPSSIDTVVGRRLVRDLGRDELLSEAAVEPAR